MLNLARRFKDLAVRGRKAKQYDRFSRTYRMGDFAEFARLAAAQLSPGAAVLEVASGPGYFCTELAKLGDFRVTGLDISDDLVDIARANAREARVDVEFRVANASRLPFANGAFDLVFCSWAMKNFMEPARVLGEMHRVLRPGAVAFIVDLNRDATAEDWKAYAAARGLGGASALAMRFAFTLQRAGAYSSRQLEELARNTPFLGPAISKHGINLHVSLVK